jgi:hypothetical protein
MVGRKSKIYVHGARNRGGMIRFVCEGAAMEHEYDAEREAREVIEHLERFLPRETFDKILELMK